MPSLLPFRCGNRSPGTYLIIKRALPWWRLSGGLSPPHHWEPKHRPLATGFARKFFSFLPATNRLRPLFRPYLGADRPSPTRKPPHFPPTFLSFFLVDGGNFRLVLPKMFVEPLEYSPYSKKKTTALPLKQPPYHPTGHAKTGQIGAQGRWNRIPSFSDPHRPKIHRYRIKCGLGGA